MPKSKNAFFYFMLNFREEQKKKGIHYNNMGEVSVAASDNWMKATPAERSKYEAIARKDKERRQVNNVKRNTNGIPIVEIERQEKILRENEEAEIKDIKNMIKLKCFNEAILDEDFFLMDVLTYCKIDQDYFVAEFTVLRFNLKEGLKDQFFEFLSPGPIPVGYSYLIKLGCEENGLEMPEGTKTKSNFMLILANLIDYLKQKERHVKVLPPIFTMPDRVEPVQNFIQQLCTRAGEDETIFRVYKLNTMFFNLINSIRTRSDEGFPKESLALNELRKDVFMFTPNLGCQIHEDAEKGPKCSLSKTKRWAYTILDYCCPVAGINVVMGAHLPGGYDLETTLFYKDKNNQRSAPSVAGNASYDPSSASSSMTSEYYEPVFTPIECFKNEKKTHVPLRMPKTDYSQNIRPAPEITEDPFPKISAGVGRGRGMCSNFAKLNIGKK